MYNPIFIILLSLGLNQGVYHIAHDGFKWDKGDALAFSTVLIGLAVPLTYMMDVDNKTAWQRTGYSFLGQGMSVGLTIALP
jgi:hypothetical protein